MDSVIYSTESQVNLIVKLIEPMITHGVKSFEVKLESELSYNRGIAARLKRTVWDGGCKSWYKTSSGKIVATFPGTLTELWWKTRTPVWEKYHQVGGVKRIAVQKRIAQLVKIVLLLATITAYLVVDHDEVKGMAAIFMLRRASEVSKLLKSLRS